MQLAARRALDELLAERNSLGGAIAQGVGGRAESVGLRLLSFGLKDVILPGDMKTLLNRVIEALWSHSRDKKLPSHRVDLTDSGASQVD